MKTETRYSYGIIPLYKEGDAYKVLLIDQLMSLRDGAEREHWTFPKGTPDEGETPLETAQREVHEEVGLTFEEIVETPHFVDTYTFMHDDVHVEKHTTYFIGFTESTNVTIDTNEVREAVWLGFDQARKQFTFDTSKEVFEKVVAHLTRQAG